MKKNKKPSQKKSAETNLTDIPLKVFRICEGKLVKKEYKSAAIELWADKGSGALVVEGLLHPAIAIAQALVRLREANPGFFFTDMTPGTKMYEGYVLFSYRRVSNHDQ